MERCVGKSEGGSSAPAAPCRFGCECWLVWVCVCMCACVSVSQKDGWVGVKWGQEVAPSPSFLTKGDGPPDVYVCVYVYGRVCVCLWVVHVACV